MVPVVLISKAVKKMTFLWILLAIIYVACWIYFGMANVPQRTLLAVLDRIHLPDPVDRRRADRPNSTRCQHGIGAIVFINERRLAEVRPLDLIEPVQG